MIRTASERAAGRCGGATSRWCRRVARGRGRALWRWHEHERKKEGGDGASCRGHWRRCAARGWRTPQPVQEQRGAVVQQIGGAGARRWTVAPAGVGEGGATERGWGGERQSVSIFTPTITRREEKRDPLSLATALRAERSVLGLSNWASAWAQGKEWARQVSKQRARGDGEGGLQRPHCVHEGAGWAELHLVLTASDIGRHSRGSGLGHQVAHDVGRLSMQPPAQRASRGEVVISPQTHPRPRMEPAFGRGSAQYVRRGCR